jgi:hypothetical protein
LTVFFVSFSNSNIISMLSSFLFFNHCLIFPKLKTFTQHYDKIFI